MEISESDWIRVKDCVERLDKNVNGNGKEPLEMRLTKYIDERDEHKARNASQELHDFEEAQKLREKENRSVQDERHKENGVKFDRLFQLVYIGMGIMIALEAIGVFKK